jgi:hypothetical protein
MRSGSAAKTGPYILVGYIIFPGSSRGAATAAASIYSPNDSYDSYDSRPERIKLNMGTRSNAAQSAVLRV